MVRCNRADAADWERGLPDASYTLAVCDGSNRYFVSPEHVELLPALAAGDAAAWDDLVDEVVRWRTAALGRWAQVTAAEPAADARVERELQAMRETFSWRVTAPLRRVRRWMAP